MFHVNTITMTSRYFLYINMLDANKYFMTNLIRILRCARARERMTYIRVGTLELAKRTFEFSIR